MGDDDDNCEPVSARASVYRGGGGGGGVVEGGFVGDDYGIRTGLKQGSFATIVLYSRDFPRQWRRIDRWYNDRWYIDLEWREGRRRFYSGDLGDF